MNKRCLPRVAARSLSEPLKVQRLSGVAGRKARAQDQVLGAAAAGVGVAVVVVAAQGAGGGVQGGDGHGRGGDLFATDEAAGRSGFGSHLSILPSLVLVERCRPWIPLRRVVLSTGTVLHTPQNLSIPPNCVEIYRLLAYFLRLK